MSMDDSLPQAVDIAVVGGGMVGGTLALSLCDMLAAQGLTVALIDAQVPAVADTMTADRAEADTDPRTTAVSYASRQILSALGCWPDDGSPIHKVHVSHRGYLGKVRISAKELGVPAVGYVIDNTSYVHHLNQHIERSTRDSGRLFHCAPAMVTGITQQDDQATLTIEQGGGVQSLTARLVIAADGARSSLRTLCGLGTRDVDYEQMGIISTVTLDKPHQQVAFERFASHGPVALLPLGTHDASLVLTADTSDAGQLMNFSDDEFLQALQHLFGRRLGQFTRVGKRTTWPLFLVDSSTNCVGRVLFIGNAARTLHPVAGQGFNLAVRDIGSLVAMLRNAAQQDTAADPGSADILAAFATSRAKDQQRTIALTDSLARVFRGANPAFSHLRSAGLLTLDRVPGARQQFGRAAMGINAGLPDLTYPD